MPSVVLPCSEMAVAGVSSGYDSDRMSPDASRVQEKNVESNHEISGTDLASCIYYRCFCRPGSPSLRVSRQSSRDRPDSSTLSWQSDDSERNWKQGAYQILVASTPDGLSGSADVWDSGRKDSSESVDIAYGGPALESRHRYFWRVRVWDSAGQMSESSESAWWEMGLLHPQDWKAKWIAWKNPEDQADRAGIRWIWVKGQDALAVAPKASADFRVTVSLKEKPRDATLFLAVRGDVRVKVNSHEVGGKSRWGAFDTIDVAEQLVAGENLIEVHLTAPDSPQWGPDAGAKTMKAGMAALIKIRLADGSIKRVASDAKWQASAEGANHWESANVVGDLTNDLTKRGLGDPGPMPQPAAYLRRSFPLAKKVQSARLYVTALGSYRVYLNGDPVAGDVLTPEFTDYRKRVLYQTYDVSTLMVSGKNVLAALLGDGWYGSPLTWEENALLYAARPFSGATGTQLFRWKSRHDRNG